MIPGQVLKAVPHGLHWWKSSKFNLGQDFHVCAYADLLEVVSVIHDLNYTSFVLFSAVVLEIVDRG